MRKLNYWGVGLLVAALCATAMPTLAQETPNDIGIFRPKSCFYPIGGAVEGVDIECGYVTVPERHANPAGSVIELAVAVIKSTNADPAPDPVVIEAGGPGFPSLISIPSALNMAAIRAERDIVLVEQRGIGDSLPSLHCEAGAQFAQEMFGQNPPDDELITLEQAVLSECYQQWIDQDIDLSAYNSLENAADFPLVMDALGYEQFNFYGVSYSSALGQHLLRDHGDRLRSVVLDSVVPLEVSFMATYGPTIERAFSKLFAACAADTTCNANFPDLEARFYALVDDYNAEPVMFTFENPYVPGTTIEAPVSGDFIILALYQQLYNFGALDTLPASLDALITGTDTYFIEQYVAPQRVGALLAISGMSNSVICSEFDVSAADVQNDNLDHPQIMAAMDTYLSYQDACAVWPVDSLPDSAFQPVTSDVPVLLLSGDFDPITPPSGAELVAQYLTHHYAYTFPGVGHSVFSNSACARSVMEQFLTEPTQEPDASCIDDLTVTFATSLGFGELTLETVTVPEFDIESVVPQGWEAIDVGVYAASGYTTLLVIAEDSSLAQTRANLSRFDDEPVDILNVNEREWTIHTVQFGGTYEGYLAFTPSTGSAIYVLLAVTTGDPATLPDALLQPMIEAFAVVE